MDNYFSLTIQGAGLQVLETVYIVRTTKNIETLKGRFQLLLERMAVLKKAAANRQYQADISLTVQKYKSIYFDRPLENQQLSAISKPNEFDMAGLYCEALLVCSSSEIYGSILSQLEILAKAQIYVL